ncbi:MAG TPA: efflux RND transporter periplasmic adaptor subunit [Anaerolineales bacterium]|jgi:RND family efflux transporter MFP subunit|nr:efflux RND transporter periplasmic adaptor subunit [Anaerolineales bacterium]
MKRRLSSLLLACVVFLSACGSGQVAGEVTPTPFPTPVRPTFTVQRGDIVVEAKLNGRVVPLALETVYFQIPGQVREVYVHVNDEVTEGELLGELAEAQELRAQADETRRTIRRAQIDLEIAQLTLEQFKSQGRSANEIKIQELQVELAQMDLEEVLQSLGIDPESSVLDELDAQVAQARAFAPADGTIIAAVNVGRNVTPDTPAFVLGDPNQLEVVADLDASKGDTEVREMFDGMPVTVTLDADADVKLTGTIRQLPSPYGTGASDERVIHVVLDSAPSTSTYQTGDNVTVTVLLASKEGVLWLPPDAIRSAGGRTFVIINSDSGPQRVDVEIGLQTRDRVEIVSGLEENQVVVGP